MSATSRLLVVLALGFVAACGEQPEKNTPPQAPTGNEHADVIRRSVNQQTNAACESAASLRARVKTFLENPSAEHLLAARTQWQSAHQAYSRLLILYELGRIKPPHIQNDRDPIDAHPVLPGYLDQVPGYPNSGLVYSEVPLTPASLLEQHQSTDFLYVTQGFHAMETLLWGAMEHAPDERALLFQRQAAPPEDRIDDRSRRAEILRLVAFALSRDMAQICSPEAQAILVQALAKVRQHPGDAIASVNSALDSLVGQKLATVEKQVAQGDQNDPSAWHAPFARADFQVMQAQVEELERRGLILLLPQLLPDGQTASDSPTPLLTRFQVLAQRLRAHDENVVTVEADEISATRDAFARLENALIALRKAEEKQGGERSASEETGQ
jgi:hypothetical protein